MAAGTLLGKYKDLLVNLLPKGRLWQPQEQPVFKGLLDSLANELCRVEQRAIDLLFEADPRQTTQAELLTDWQRLLGLPDECTPEIQTIDEKQQQITQKYTNVGGLSKTFYEALTLNLGFVVIVENRVNFIAGRARAGDKLTNYFNRVFEAGDTAGTQLREIGWRFYFEVNMPIEAATVFVAGSDAGDPIRTFENPVIECTMQKLKPARAAIFPTFRE